MAASFLPGAVPLSGGRAPKQAWAPLWDHIQLMVKPGRALLDFNLADYMYLFVQLWSHDKKEKKDYVWFLEKDLPGWRNPDTKETQTTQEAKQIHTEGLSSFKNYMTMRPSERVMHWGKDCISFIFYVPALKGSVWHMAGILQILPELNWTALLHILTAGLLSSIQLTSCTWPQLSHRFLKKTCPDLPNVINPP